MALLSMLVLVRGEALAQAAAPEPTPAEEPPLAPPASPKPAKAPEGDKTIQSDTFKKRVSNFQQTASALKSTCELAKLEDDKALKKDAVGGANPAPAAKEKDGGSGKKGPTEEPAVKAPTKVEAETAFTKFKKDVCELYCSGTEDGSKFDICAFRDKEKATVAVIVDFASVRAIADFLKEKLGTFSAFKGGRVAELDSALRTLREDREAGALGAVTGLFSADTVGTIASGLARFLVDRAKREGVGWFLAEMGQHLCGWGHPTPVQSELSEYWFPALCSLASSKEDFIGYGGGGRLFEALRAAIISDVSGWPATAGGAALGLLYWKAVVDTKGDAKKSAFETCAPESTNPECAAFKEVRGAGHDFVRGILRGHSASAEGLTLATRIDAVNRAKATDTTPAKLKSVEIQIAACAASLPAQFEVHAKEVQSVDLPSGLAQGRALFFAGMTAAPACWTIFGSGARIGSCDPVDGKDGTVGKEGKAEETDCSVSTSALAEPLKIERLTTILRLYDKLGARADVVSEHWKRLKEALENYKQVASAPRHATATATAASPTQLNVADGAGAAELLAAITQQASEAARNVQRSHALEQLRAALDVAHAATNLGMSAIDLSSSAVTTGLYPGFACHLDSTDPGHVAFKSKLAQGRLALQRLGNTVDILRGVLSEDWGQVVIGSVATLRAAFDKKTPNSPLLKSLTRYAGVVTAIAAERDPDRIAEAIENAADPVGGWMRKGKTGVWTVSLMSHVGVFGGAEWRYGRGVPAGTPRDHGEKVHGVAPVLALPVGIEIARGSTCFFGSPTALFLSLIDPAGFLQYDPGDQGALPAPRPTTVLAPGFAVRIGFRNTPFSISPSFFYRPALRTASSNRSGPASSALQLGVNASVDVTLFELSRYVEEEAL